MDANKIKFVDNDGSAEVVDPPMTSRIHKETGSFENTQETIEEKSSNEEVSIKSSSDEEKPSTISVGSEHLLGENDETNSKEVNASLDVTSERQSLDMSLVRETLIEKVIEDAVEQNVKVLEKMESVLSSSIEASVEDLKSSVEEPKTDEVKDEIDKEALSLVANAVNDIRAEERVPVTPKGCCILQ